MGVPDPSKRHRELEVPADAADSAVDSHQQEPARRIESAPAGDVRGALELVALVAAPTTILAAFAFFFGWTFTNARTSYFGIDPSTLGFSTQDYLLRSTDALFVPLGTMLVLGLLAVGLHAVAKAALTDPRRQPAVRRTAHGALVAGAVLFAIGVVAVFEPLPFSSRSLVPPVSLGVGVALLAYGLHVLRPLDAPQPKRASGALLARPLSPSLAATLVTLLVGLSGFWAASRYAESLGISRAKRLAATIDSRPRVEVFAPRRLHIAARGVIEHRLSGADSAYRYSYSGLRLLVRSGGRYFLLPEGWSRRKGAAIVLSDTPALRFEFGAGR